MKDIAWAVVGFLVLISLVLLVRFGASTLNNHATAIIVHEVDVGVKCATLATADGVAIDCWSE